MLCVLKSAPKVPFIPSGGGSNDHNSSNPSAEHPSLHSLAFGSCSRTSRAPLVSVRFQRLQHFSLVPAAFADPTATRVSGVSGLRLPRKPANADGYGCLGLGQRWCPNRRPSFPVFSGPQCTVTGPSRAPRLRVRPREPGPRPALAQAAAHNAVLRSGPGKRPGMPLASRVVRPGTPFASWRVSEAADLELTAGRGNGCPGQRLAEAAGAAPLSVPGCAQASGRLEGFRKMLLRISPGLEGKGKAPSLVKKKKSPGK